MQASVSLLFSCIVNVITAKLVMDNHICNSEPQWKQQLSFFSKIHV